MDARALAELHDLARRDEELAAVATRIEELSAAVAHIRARADAIEVFFAGYPERESRARAAVAKAEANLERRRSELTAADRDLTDARTDDERLLAAKAIARAHDHVADAESGHERARSSCEQLEGDAAELPSELAALETEASEISNGDPLLATFSGAGPRALGEWASQVHAELFVALSQLAAERERLIREANELASMLLGESTYGSTVTQALRQVEARATAR